MRILTSPKAARAVKVGRCVVAVIPVKIWRTKRGPGNDDWYAVVEAWAMANGTAIATTWAVVSGVSTKTVYVMIGENHWW